MSHCAVLDPRPLDYRSSFVAGVILAPDVSAAMDAVEGRRLRLRTSRNRSALCRIVAATEHVGTGSVRIDRFTRQALKAFPHEEVQLELVEPPPATELGLIPGIDMSQQYDPRAVPALKSLLVEQGVAVCPGMLLYIRLPGGLAGVTYSVHSVQADGVEGVVTDETTIWMIDKDHSHHGPADHHHDHDPGSETVVDTTFEDVGGLTTQIREVRESVELPLVFPQVYRQLGINPPRGVIFHGAPGTGKTLLARSVASEISAQLFKINGPEIVGTYSGETEANLRQIFAEASQHPPSIIFIDELDAIAPFRRTASTQSEARAVTQLLALLDGLKNVEGVLAIGTTNRVEAIDPALRRAGRFDREVYFPSPPASAREQILRVQTREMPLDDGALAALPSVAERAHGFVGADLMELSREAGLTALRRAASSFVESPSIANYPAANDLVVSAQDFETALAKVHPSSLRDSLIAYPNIGWGDIGGLEHVKRRLRDLVEQPLRHPEAFARAGLSSNLGVLLHGPAGTGKTLLAQAIARESGVNFIPINGPELFSQWLGESEESVRHIFDVASRTEPCVVFFDQLDAVAPRRDALEQEGTRAPQRVVNQLLAELDGLKQRGRVIVIGATNRVSMVDPAVIRPGRFGVQLHVGPPSHPDRVAILEIHLRDVNLALGLSLEQLIEDLVPRTDGMVGADLAYVCQNAKLTALAETNFEGDPTLELAHFESVLQEVAQTLKEAPAGGEGAS